MRTTDSFLCGVRIRGSREAGIRIGYGDSVLVTEDFLMVTGAATMPRGTGSQRPGNCVVYVADANSGAVAAYYIPWNRGLETTGRPQAGPLVLLRKGQVRNLQIRE